ncbi:hypothetical protein AB2B41_02135 [Marimonas sp. MJW-29]|uniref:Uncharacterized protein n=1 Tax=Sulfitobacter sediminis TaxID=3234186 RepID=A0ABV3RJW3_9RHOB
MAHIEHNAPWRAGIVFAKIRQIGVTLKHLFKALKPSGTIGRPRFSAHIARDIGLTPHELELLNHRWPSEEARHPRL